MRANSIERRHGSRRIDHTTGLLAVALLVPAVPLSGQAPGCTPYAPLGQASGFVASWDRPGELDTLVLSAPASRAGGIVRVDVHPRRDVGAILSIRLPGAGVAAVDRTGLLDGQGTVIVEVGPSQNVQLTVRSQRNLAPTSYPIEYDVRWIFDEKMDCFEPNDVIPDAKSVAVNQPIRARLVEDRRDNAHEPRRHVDWYRFQLPGPADVMIELTAVPPDVAFGIALRRRQGGATVPVDSAVAPAVGAALTLAAGRLGAGEYLVSFEPAAFAGGSDAATGSGPAPAHFDEPYEFRVVARPPAGAPGGSACTVGSIRSESSGFGGNWNAPNDRNEHEFTIPADPMLGVTEVRLIPGGSVGPRLLARIAGEGTVAQANGERGETVRIAFEGAPGDRVEVTAISSLNAPRQDYPVGYSIQWQYAGRADCYEPNEAPASAWDIPFGEDITAYFVAPPSQTQHEDWYRFSLATPSAVVVRLLELPSDVQVGMAVFESRPDGPGRVANVVGPRPGVRPTLTTGILSPGTYYLRMAVGRLASGMASANHSRSNPPHFDRPYRFRLERPP